jgi:serine/threonine protein kinase
MSNNSTVNLRPGRSDTPSADSPGDASDLPQAFGRYQVIRFLASGGMGSVFLARDGVLAREVAVKCLRPFPGALGKEFNSRFLVEARCIAALNHPNIVPIYDLGVEGNAPYLVMEVVPGPSLAALIESNRPGSSQVRTIGIQMANALAQAHREGIVHRDVKPANVLRAAESHWKLVDFGVAHAPDSSLTGAGDFLGTPAYSAPESLEGEGFTAASDVYGLAATLYHALCGQPPYGVGNAVQIALKISTEPPVSLAQRAPHLPADLVQVVECAMSRDPAARPTAEQFAQLLAAAGATEDATGPVNILTSTQSPSVSRKRSRMLAAVATLTACAGAIAAIAAMGDRSASPAAAEVTAIDPAPPQPVTSAETDSMEDFAADRAPATGVTDAVQPTRGAGGPQTSSPENREAPGIGDPEPGLTGLKDVDRLIARHSTKQALRKLDQLRKRHPDSAYLPYLQGTLYMERRWWKDGFAAYRAALARNPEYRASERMIADGIRALYSKTQPWRGSAFLQKDIGAPARPHLEEAAREVKSSKVRGRIRALIRKLPAS